MQGNGGVAHREHVSAIANLQSGPAGGMIAAAFVAGLAETSERHHHRHGRNELRRRPDHRGLLALRSGTDRRTISHATADHRYRIDRRGRRHHRASRSRKPAGCSLDRAVPARALDRFVMTPAASRSPSPIAISPSASSIPIIFSAARKSLNKDKALRSHRREHRPTVEVEDARSRRRRLRYRQRQDVRFNSPPGRAHGLPAGGVCHLRLRRCRTRACRGLCGGA